MTASSDLLDAAFGGHAQIVAPWPRPGRRKGDQLYDRDMVSSFVGEQPRLTDVDPADLYATQTWVLRSHVSYYSSGEWERTGRTSADMHQRANRYPLLYRDGRGRLLILAGHHRSMAALIEGRSVQARLVGASPDVGVAITPSVVTPSVVAGDDDTATIRLQLARNGLSELEVGERLRFAGLDE